MVSEDWIENINDYISCINQITDEWVRSGNMQPWFRGQKNREYKLISSILRKGNIQKEFDITREFRLRAPGFIETPDRDRIDQWLFLMQHYEVPTKLFDELDKLGISKTVVFPSLGRLSTEIKYRYKC